MRQRLPSTGSPAGRASPASTVPRAAPTSRRPSRRASLPSLGGTRLVPVFVPNHAEHARGRPGAVCSGWPPSGLCRRETTGPPTFLGNPGVHMPCSKTPVGSSPLDRLQRPDAAFRTVWTTSAPTNSPLSRLNHTAWALAVYASQGGLPQPHARLASGCRSALPGRIGYLPGSSERFHAKMDLWTHCAVLLSQAFRGAPALGAARRWQALKGVATAQAAFRMGLVEGSHYPAPSAERACVTFTVTRAPHSGHLPLTFPVRS